MMFINRVSIPFQQLFVSLSLIFALAGCNEYHAADEVGYPTVWYVTVKLEDGTERSIMQEEMKNFASENESAKGVLGVDRRNGEEIVIPFEKAIYQDPASTLIVKRHQSPQASSIP